LVESKEKLEKINKLIKYNKFLHCFSVQKFPHFPSSSVSVKTVSHGLTALLHTWRSRLATPSVDALQYQSVKRIRLLYIVIVMMMTNSQLVWQLVL
jgi:hypothetical protein